MEAQGLCRDTVGECLQGLGIHLLDSAKVVLLILILELLHWEILVDSIVNELFCTGNVEKWR